MSTITVANPAHLAREEQRRHPGLLSRILAAVIEARRLSAQRRVVDHLDSMSDERLSGLGLSDADIGAIRRKRWHGITVEQHPTE